MTNDHPTARSLVMKKAAFSLLEILITCAIIGALAAFAIPAINTARSSALRTQCASNLRQIGLALQQYTTDNTGSFPLTMHSLNSRYKEQSWIYTLAPYLDNIDRVRVCPADPPQRQQRILTQKATSYALNELVFDEEAGYNNIYRIPLPSRTLLAVILSENRAPSTTWDHIHSSQWTSWTAMLNDVQVDRHLVGSRARLSADRTRGSANYLYADSHVENIPAATMKKILDSGTNPAAIPQS